MVQDQVIKQFRLQLLLDFRSLKKVKYRRNSLLFHTAFHVFPSFQTAKVFAKRDEFIMIIYKPSPENFLPQKISNPFKRQSFPRNSKDILKMNQNVAINLRIKAYAKTVVEGITINVEKGTIFEIFQEVFL